MNAKHNKDANHRAQSLLQVMLLLHCGSIDTTIHYMGLLYITKGDKSSNKPLPSSSVPLKPRNTHPTMPARSVSRIGFLSLCYTPHRNYHLKCQDILRSSPCTTLAGIVIDPQSKNLHLGEDVQRIRQRHLTPSHHRLIG